jgi:hypothetical protein
MTRGAPSWNALKLDRLSRQRAELERLGAVQTVAAGIADENVSHWQHLPQSGARLTVESSEGKLAKKTDATFDWPSSAVRVLS